MKRSWLIKIEEFFKRKSKKPWACFETDGPDSHGKVSFSISYNSAFVKNLEALGWEGTTPEETVQMFFLQIRMIPDEFVSDDAINPEATPNLTNESNTLRRG